MTAIAAVQELHAIEAELTRRQYLRDPVGWVQDVLGGFLWSKQRQIMESVRAHRRTAVPSCHDSGKSHVAARIVAWWLDVHPPGSAFVVSTAPTWPQVRAILWREINRAHAIGGLRGRCNQTEWHMIMPEGHEAIVALGRKPGDLDPTAFQGFHSLYTLVIIDEACGVATPLWEAADTLLTNEGSRILAIGNPDDPNTEFEKVCRPGSGWHVIHIDGLKTPNFTREKAPQELTRALLSRTWQREKLAKWGERSPMYIAKLRGRFPETATDGLIPVSWVKAAQTRELEPGDPNELGVDVGGGGDKTVIAQRRGPVVRILSRDTNPDTMQTCGHVLQQLTASGATLAKVDPIGIGRGVVDRAQEQGKPVIGINVGEKPRDSERFLNRRAELYWGLRERFQDGDVDLEPADDDLAEQLMAIRFKTTSRGQIQIESKEEMKKRGLSSPDDADAVMLAFAFDQRETASGMPIGIGQRTSPWF